MLNYYYFSNILFIYLTLFCCLDGKLSVDEEEVADVKKAVKLWIKDFGEKLNHYSEYARRNDVEKAFENYAIIEEKWSEIVENIAKHIREMMKQKIEAVKAIKEHAEQLALHRNEPIPTESSYDFYDANNLTETEIVDDRSADLEEREKIWRCHIDYNITCAKDNRKYENYKQKSPTHDYYRCDRVAFLPREKDFYRQMKLEYNPHFDDDVNLEHSIIRVTPSVHPRAEEVLNDIRWSEGLDLVYKCNFKKDPTLTWQYFGSPKGFMRLYPAIQWSTEAYDQTFDFRLRPWFIEGISSAKDIIILLDRTGSMTGLKKEIAIQVVNSILDTLTDNDYVNIYTFTNSTEPLVDCFADVLVQANEENLRLLREQLKNVEQQFNGDISLGLEKAFPLLWKFRKARRGGIECNQAIMLITQGLDYEYKDVLFKIYNHMPNEKYYRPIRVFTYQIGNEPLDAQRMTWIACANMGYYVNISLTEEVRNKVLKYLEVLSRPINMSPLDESLEPAWSALHVHLADRRLSNFLWKKNEGLRQRDKFIAYEKQYLKQEQLIIKPKQNYFTLEKEHPFDIYMEQRDYKYLTAVSMPVRDLRPNATSLLGVAGVDVPLDYIKQLTQPHRIGVNGYAFIITNNGYVLYHPDHRKELRERIVLQEKGYEHLNIRMPLDNMRRVILGRRHYFYTEINPFSLVIALPDRYGFLVTRYERSKINKTEYEHTINRLKEWRNWRIHPNWLYTCKSHQKYDSPESDLLAYLNNNLNCKADKDLIFALLRDAKFTESFDDFNARNPIDGLILSFLSTHAGLTRWKNYTRWDEDKQHFANIYNEAADEIYYRRSAELNYHNPEMFIYSVPFEDYDENKTLVMGSNVVYIESDNKRAPVAAVGVQILHKKLNAMLNNLRIKKGDQSLCTKSWKCFVLDNDGYIILANDTNLISKYIMDVDKNLTEQLVKDGVYKEITVYDYQETCLPEYNEEESTDTSYGPTVEDVKKPIKNCNTPIKCKTIEYLKQKLQKTTPTPCDKELKMLNSNYRSAMQLFGAKSDSCACHYIAEPIKKSNLMFVMVNNTCCAQGEALFDDYPKELQYNSTLPCFIAVYNNFTKRYYTKCITKNEKEFTVNKNITYCGGEGYMPLE